MFLDKRGKRIGKHFTFVVNDNRFRRHIRQDIARYRRKYRQNELKGIVARAVVDFFGNFCGYAPRVVLNGESFEFENGLAQAVLNRLPVVFVDYRVGGGDCRKPAHDCLFFLVAFFILGDRFHFVAEKVHAINIIAVYGINLENIAAESERRLFFGKLLSSVTHFRKN